MTDWKPVVNALLGSWPSQVTSWGREVIAAYCQELQARGVSPERALIALRSCPADQRFPPSAPELAGLARTDPSRPTFDEMIAQLYGPGGVFGFKRSSVTISPWVEVFVDRHGRERLRMLEIDDPTEGKWRRRELEQAWEAFLEATEGRAVHEIAARSVRGTLSRVDPLALLPQRPVGIGAGDER